ncbi:MAG: helix-turn-helix transcriptional regulator [Candidatus Hydrogenedentes bacterium]|nr:helix-turn-helix transcriptional regulator [Candidatus Hydrogenedentota bacterium]
MDAPALPPAHAKILERAARVAGVPVAVHRLRGAAEALAAGWGGCAVCRAACGSAAGKAACARSRASARPLARAQGGPVTLFCHLGLGCATAAWPGASDLMLTFGPYVPSGEDRGLAVAVRRALAALPGGRAPEKGVLAPLVAEIPRTPPGAVLAALEWTLEELARAPFPAEAAPEEQAATKETALPAPPRRTARRKDAGADFDAARIALAASGGKWAEVRAMLGEAAAARTGTRRTRSAAFLKRLAEALAAAREAGGDTAGAWSVLAELSADVEAGAPDAEALAGGGARVLRAVKWPGKRPGAGRQVLRPRLQYAPLNTILFARYAQRVTLAEVAAELGENPTTITHRLQRNFGLSFSDYLACVRAEKAKPLLRRTRASLAEVGRRVGFSDASNFARAFLKVTGMRPAEYRALHARPERRRK